MSGTGALRRILAFTSAVEAGTGLVLVIAPGFVVRWLLGAGLPGAGEAAARCFGIALVALALACWPRVENLRPASLAMLLYNALIAVYLGYLGTAGKMTGALLWPAVALHAVVALGLAATRRGVDPG